MPPKKKDHDIPTVPVTPPDHIVQRPGAPEINEELPDAAALLYKDRSGAARTQGVTEGSGYSSTMAKLAREAAGVPEPEEFT